jgi:SAM-dependent methyltransferase
MIVDNTIDFKSTPITGTELLIGAGNSREKQLALPEFKEWKDLITLDIDHNCNPDVLWDMNHLPLPFEDETFEEIHAYEVLEHFGKQGDWKTFFAQFTEFHRILKPGGHFFATVPMWDSQWAWADPGHTRVIAPGSLTFLEQRNYENIGSTPMTDYRHCYKADFEIVHSQEVGERFAFVLKKK